MNIAILFGGKSAEHDVSKISAASVLRNIDRSKFTVTAIGIAKNGIWYYQPDAQHKAEQNEPLEIIESDKYKVRVIPGAGTHCFEIPEKVFTIDAVFPVLHGTYGEDGTIQGLFEMCNIPYVGGGVMASSIAMDKEKTKQIWSECGLPVVPFQSVKIAEWTRDAENIIAEIEKTFPYPVFVKPCCAGSSVGASKVADKKHLIAGITEAFRWDSKILIEPFIHAREIECSVTGNDKPMSYTLGEIGTSAAYEFYDYTAKYLDADGAKLLLPAALSAEITAEIKAMAEKAYAALDLTGLSRCDFFFDKDTGKILLNEINTIPGFTSISMFPRMCEASGLNYSDLLSLLITLAVDRFNSRKNFAFESQ